MKKNYFFLAAAATLFAACAETDVLVDLSEKENAPKAIGFETFADNITRAVSDATKLESYHDAFGVWAYKTVGSKESLVMGNYQVEHQDSKWVYAGVNNQTIKYWDKSASYEFFAYAPYNAAVKIENDQIKIEAGEYAANENLQTTWGTAQNDSDFSGTGDNSTTKSTDWMLASKVSKGVGVNTTVDEVFAHTMSKLIVILKSSSVDTGAKVIVESVSVNNVYGTGSFDGSTWTATGSAKSISGVVGEIESDDDDDDYYSMEYLLIPSTTAPTFSITYTVNGDKNTVTNAQITGISGFEANTCYTLTANIGLAPIEFSAKATDFTANTNGSVSIQ